MTEQEIFDKVATHLLVQKEQARDTSGRCTYLSPSGRRCAVGALIPDDHPGLRFTGDVANLLEKYDDLDVMLGEHYCLLETLQGVHDYFEPTKWPDQLQSVAREFDLSTAAIERNS